MAIEKKRLFSPVQGRSNPEKKVAMFQTPPSNGNKQGNSSRSLAVKAGFELFDPNREGVSSNHASLTDQTPYTNNFFAKLAKTVSNTFPFEKFAEENNCEVEDVVRAIKTTIIAPLSKPSIQQRSGQSTLGTAKTTNATESVRGNTHIIEDKRCVVKLDSARPHLQPPTQKCSKLDSIDPVKVRIPTVSTNGGSAIDNNEMVDHVSRTSNHQDDSISVKSVETDQTEPAKQSEHTGRKSQDGSHEKKSQVVFKIPQVPKHTLRPPISLGGARIESAVYSVNDKGAHANSSTGHQSPHLPRSAKRRKTMAPVERQLVTQDLYGNYVPVEREKSTIRLIRDK